MAKFINIDDINIVNIDEIETIDRKLFDLSKKDFTGKEIETEKEVELDYLNLVLAEISFKNGRILKVNTIIYSEDDYVKEIDRSWKEFINCLDCKYIELY